MNLTLFILLQCLPALANWFLVPAETGARYAQTPLVRFVEHQTELQWSPGITERQNKSEAGAVNIR